MKSCCESKSDELAELRTSQGKVLKILLALNASMFFVEFTAAWWLGSTALLGDSLDMFGDASVYALTLYVLHRSLRERALSALVKGIVMLVLGLIVLVEAGDQALNGVAPAAHGMGAFALLALAVNLVCFGLLWRFKSDDLNMRSTWLCSRNDIMANAAVFVAAILVGWTGSRWPDVLLGAAIAALFLQSSWQVIRDARAELREAAQTSPQAASAPAQSDGSSGCAPVVEPARSGCCATTPRKVETSCCATPIQAETPRSAQVADHEPTTMSSCCSTGKTCRDD